jgi:hypothetical protein
MLGKKYRYGEGVQWETAVFSGDTFLGREIFSSILILDSASNRNEYQESSWGQRPAGAQG